MRDGGPPGGRCTARTAREHPPVLEVEPGDTVGFLKAGRPWPLGPGRHILPVDGIR